MASRPRQPIRLALAACVTVAYGWWATGLPPFSTSATVAVVGPGAVVALVAVGRRPVPRTATARPDTRSGLIWGGLVAALVGWQLAAWAQGPRSQHPTLSSLVNDALEPRPMRAIAFALWLAGAAWLGRR
jgi:hypothetical protein